MAELKDSIATNISYATVAKLVAIPSNFWVPGISVGLEVGPMGDPAWFQWRHQSEATADGNKVLIPDDNPAQGRFHIFAGGGSGGGTVYIGPHTPDQVSSTPLDGRTFEDGQEWAYLRLNYVENSLSITQRTGRWIYYQNAWVFLNGQALVSGSPQGQLDPFGIGDKASEHQVGMYGGGNVNHYEAASNQSNHWVLI